MSGESVESQIIEDIRREYEKTYPSVMFTLTNRIEAQEAELAAKDAEIADTKLALLDMEGKYEAGLALIQAKDAENARLREALAKAQAVSEALLDLPHNRLASRGIKAIDEVLTVALSVSKDAEPDTRRPVAPLPTRGAWLSLEQLREIEWAGWDDTLNVACCPVCLTTAGLGDGHAPDCWLAAKIKQAEEAQL